MALIDITRTHLRRSIDLYQELATEIPERSLSEKLPGLPSNTIGQQFWCVIGARESYGRAIAAGQWSGFSCSLPWEQCNAKAEVLKALESTGSGILATLSGDSFTDRQNQLILDVLEHEAAHQGQLIRYLYGLKLPIPDGWKSRYALD